MSSVHHLKLHDGWLYLLAGALFMMLIAILYCTYKYVDQAIETYSNRNTPRSSVVSSRRHSLYLAEDAKPLTAEYYGQAEPLPVKSAIFRIYPQSFFTSLTPREREITQIRCEECERMSQSANSSFMDRTLSSNITYIPPTEV